MNDPDPAHVEAGRRAADTRQRRDAYIATKTDAYTRATGKKPGKRLLEEWREKSKVVVTS